MNIPLEDILETRYVKEQASHGLEEEEVFERRLNRLLYTYINTFQNCHLSLLDINGTLTIEFNPSSEGLQINMNYNDGMSWNTSQDRENFNDALVHKLRSKASFIRTERQHKEEKQ